jgi:hypothetical protein
MVLRIAKFFTIICVALTVAQPHLYSQTQPGQPLTVRVESPTAEKSGTTETLKAVSELISALAWPAVFVILLVTQRRTLTRLLESLVELVRSSHHIKVGDLIDVEVDRSARQAEQQSDPASGVSFTQVEAASRVTTLVGQSELPTVRAKMLEFAREYEATRSSMASGPERTRTMNAIVAKMRTLALAAKPLLREFSLDENSPGTRLAAISILELSPDPSYVDWLVARMSIEQPFVLFHSSLALLAIARNCVPADRDRVRDRIERALAVVRSFKGGRPDTNTVENLQTALSELGRVPNV